MLSLRNLFRRKVRTLLTVIGVGVGVSIVVALASVARGFRTQVNGMFATGQAHLILSRQGATDPILSYLPDSMLGDLRAHPAVAEVHPVVFAARQTADLAAFVFYGTTDGSPFLRELRIVDGKALYAEGLPEHRIVLGRRAAKNLDKAVGDVIPVGVGEYEVTGIFESVTPLIEAGAILPFEEAQSIAGLDDKVSTFLVSVRQMTPEGLVAAEASIEESFPVVEATSPTAWTDAFKEFELADQTVTVFTLLAVAIGGISVMNTMLMSVFERTREFGVMQAIGWSRGMVLREVLAEALLVAAAGGPLGIALGIGVVELVGSFRQFSWVAGNYAPSVLLLSLGVGFGMAIVGSAYPAWRAVRIQPVEALRYE